MRFFVLTAALSAMSFAAMAEIKCPPMPEAVTTTQKDVKVAIDASVRKIYTASANLSTETKNLYSSYPNVDKLLLRQTFLSTYCSMLSTSKLSDTEKLDRFEKATREFQIMPTTH